MWPSDVIRSLWQKALYDPSPSSLGHAKEHAKEKKELEAMIKAMETRLEQRDKEMEKGLRAKDKEMETRLKEEKD